MRGFTWKSTRRKKKHIYIYINTKRSTSVEFRKNCPVWNFFPSGWLPAVATHELLIICSWFSHKQILLWLQVRFRRASMPIKTVSADRASIAQWGCPLFMNLVHENRSPNFKSQIGPLVHCGMNLTAAAHKNREFCAQYYSVATI